MSGPVTPDTRVGDLLDRHPAIVEVFASFHAGDTRGAHLPRAATLEQLARAHDVPLPMFLEALSAWIEENGSQAGNPQSD